MQLDLLIELVLLQDCAQEGLRRSLSNNIFPPLYCLSQS